MRRAEERARQEAERVEQERIAREEAARKAEEEARRKVELERLKQERAEAEEGGQEEEGGGEDGEGEGGDEGKEEDEEGAEKLEEEEEEEEVESQKGGPPQLKVTDSAELHPSEEDLTVTDEDEQLNKDFPPDLPETEEFKSQRATFERDFPPLIAIIKGTNNLEPIPISVEKDEENMNKEVTKKIEGTSLVH